MNSTLKIYKNCEILPDRAFKVDSIATYLSGFLTSDVIVVNNFQFIKHALNLTIKVDLSQTYLEHKELYNFNYMSVQNSTTGVVIYYFIIDKKWIAESTCQFVLSMDTINTFVGDASLVLSDKTKILRQHEDRFIKQYNKLWPKIDFYSEGLTPELYGIEEEELEDPDTFSNQNWYLIYRNQNEPSDSLVNPVNCYLMPEKESYFDSYKKYHIEFSAGGLYAALQNYPDVGGYQAAFWIIGKFNPTCTIILENANHEVEEVINLLSGVRSAVFYRSGTDVKLILVSADGSQIGSGWTINSSTYPFIDITNLYVIKYANKSTSSVVSSIYDERNVRCAVYYNYTYADADFITDFAYIRGISNVDRTRAELIKIILMPYCPIEFVHPDSGPLNTFTFTSGAAGSWTTDLVAGIGAVLKLSYLPFNLQRRITFSPSNLNPYDAIGPRDLPSNWNGNKSIGYETKLFHSDYQYTKIVYDSFGFVVALEKITNQQRTADAWPLASLKMDYRAANTLNSRFAFEVVDYNCDGYETQDYNKLMVITRNNEMPIFNQQFLNYLRSGFNFDVKSKTRTETAAWAGVGLSAIGSIASFVAGGPIGVVAGVGMATSTVAQLINAVNTTAQAEQNIQQKEQQLKMQATGVYGSDDVNLMLFYAHNRLKLKQYSCSDRVQKALWDLFFYTGYVHNILGVPNTTSRCRFNFVQAEPIFKKTPNLPKEIIDDIVNKYKVGFTYIHYYNNTWDFAQEKENWEVSLLPTT